MLKKAKFERAGNVTYIITKPIPGKNYEGFYYEAESVDKRIAELEDELGRERESVNELSLHSQELEAELSTIRKENARLLAKLFKKED